MSSIKMVKTHDLDDHLNTRPIEALTGYIQTTIWKPDHLTTKHKSTIWIPDSSGIQMVTVVGIQMVTVVASNLNYNCVVLLFFNDFEDPH